MAGAWLLTGAVARPVCKPPDCKKASVCTAHAESNSTRIAVIYNENVIFFEAPVGRARRRRGARS